MSARSALLVCIVLLVSIVGCGEPVIRDDAPYSKVIVLGIDGMDPEVTRALMDEGKLPHFKQLAESGVFLPLDTSYPPESPVAWTTIATGANPGQHGVFDFIVRNPDTYLPELSIPKSSSGFSGTRYESPILTETFWELSSDAQIPTTVIRWPVTFPPDDVEGKMLSGLGTPDVRGLLSGYTLVTELSGPEGVKSPNRVITVDGTDSTYPVTLLGPKSTAGTASEASLEVQVSELGIELFVDGETHELGVESWSGWIPVSFDVGLQSVSGIFKVYVESVEPFEMYITSVHIHPADPVFEISYPAGYSAELVDDIGLYSTLGMPEENAGYEDGALNEDALVEHILDVEVERTQMFWKVFDELQLLDSGVLAFVFDSSDRLQHLFWTERVLEPGDETLHPVIEQYYVEKDTLLREILEQLDDDTLLLIVSDHGFTSFERAVDINRWLVDNGYMTLT